MVLRWDLGFSKGLPVCMDLWMTIGAAVVGTLRQKALLSPSVRWWHHIHPAGDHHDEGVQAQKHSGLFGHLPQVCPIHFWTFLIGWWIHEFITVFLHLTLILHSPTFSFYLCRIRCLWIWFRYCGLSEIPNCGSVWSTVVEDHSRICIMVCTIYKCTFDMIASGFVMYHILL